MDDSKIYYVYVLFRPWNGQPCYVGKGKDDRWLIHEKRWRKAKNKNLSNIFKKAGGPIPKVKVRQFLTEREAIRTEIALIADIGRKVDNGPLVNITSGGDGMAGTKLSPERLARLVAANKGVKRPGYILRLSENARKRLSECNKGKKRSPETCAKISAARMGRFGRPHTAEEIAKIAAKSKGRKHTPEHREKISAALMGHRLSQETKEKIAASHVRRNQQKTKALDHKADAESR